MSFSGWKYRKLHIINGATNAGTLYQIRIKVHYGSGNDSGEDVYLNGHCRTDFGDLRFTDNDRTTELDYWIQEKVDSDYAVIWIEVTDDLNIAQTIYVYYGKADAIYPFGDDQDEMNATFLFADHFYGESLDLNKWTLLEGDVNVSNSSLTLTGTNGTRGRIDGVTTFGPNVAYHTKARVSSTIPALAANLGSMRNGPTFTDNILLYFPDPWTIQSRKSDTSSETGAGIWYYSTVDWHTYRIEWTTNIKLYQDDTLTRTKYDNIPTVPLRCYNREPITVDRQVYIDWVFIRKFVSPEPAHGAWGDEQLNVILYETLSCLPHLILEYSYIGQVNFLPLRFLAKRIIVQLKEKLG